MIFKVCGMRDPENIRRIDLSGADWMGFVFYPPSPRRVESLPAFMPEYARRVGVFVDEPVENIQVRAKEFGLDYLQLHGSESPDDCLRLQNRGLRVIKAFRIGTAGDLEATAAYEAACSYFLFDTKTPAYGGSGKTFDWTVLDAYRGQTPFLLSGGIGPEHVRALKAFRHDRLVGYDLNSRFEQAPGIKDVEKITRFIQDMKCKK